MCSPAFGAGWRPVHLHHATAAAHPNPATDPSPPRERSGARDSNVRDSDAQSTERMLHILGRTRYRRPSRWARSRPPGTRNRILRSWTLVARIRMHNHSPEAVDVLYDCRNVAHRVPQSRIPRSARPRRRIRRGRRAIASVSARSGPRSRALCQSGARGCCSTRGQMDRAGRDPAADGSALVAPTQSYTGVELCSGHSTKSNYSITQTSMTT